MLVLPRMNLQTGSGGVRLAGGLQPSNRNGISIFGDIALKATFVVFYAGNKQIGRAAKNLQTKRTKTDMVTY